MCCCCRRRSQTVLLDPDELTIDSLIVGDHMEGEVIATAGTVEVVARKAMEEQKSVALNGPVEHKGQNGSSETEPL